MREVWFYLIETELSDHDEAWADVIASTPSLATEWQHFFQPSDFAFTIWTPRRVYFPATYDGMFWCASAPRQTCGEKVDPVGGG
jgi:hypothetical protein